MLADGCFLLAGRGELEGLSPSCFSAIICDKGSRTEAKTINYPFGVDTCNGQLTSERILPSGGQVIGEQYVRLRSVLLEVR